MHAALQVVVGELLLVKPGSSVPVDGLVVGGASAVDESMLTGDATCNGHRRCNGRRGASAVDESMLTGDVVRVVDDTR